MQGVSGYTSGGSARHEKVYCSDLGHGSDFGILELVPAPLEQASLVGNICFATCGGGFVHEWNEMAVMQ